MAPGGRGGRGGGGGGRGGGRGESPFYAALTSPELRDPRGFILPSDQPDFGTATKFVNTLMKTGHHDPARDGAVHGRRQGVSGRTPTSCKTAQAFRPHVMDMFEPQDHPDDIPYPGGPPTPPYDSTGYTLAYQMGVKFDRILDDFDGPFEKLTDFAKVPPARSPARSRRPATTSATRPTTASSRSTGCWRRAKRCRGCRTARWGAARSTWPRRPTTRAILQKAAAISASASSRRAAAPAGPASTAAKAAHRLVRYLRRQQLPSGWTRLILENFEFPYERVFPPDLDKGGLRDKYDVIVFNGAGLQAGGAGGAGSAPAGALRHAGAADAAAVRGEAGGGGAAGARRRRAGFTPQPIPEEFARRQGQVTAGTLGADQAVRPGGRHGHRDRRRRDGRRAAVRAARRRITCSRTASPMPRDEVLRARARCCASPSTTTNPLAHGLGEGARRLLRQQSGLQARSPRPRRKGLQERRVVREPRRCEAAGRGASSTSTRASRSSRPTSARAGCSCWRPKCCSGRSRTATTSCSSTACICRWRGRSRAVLERTDYFIGFPSASEISSSPFFLRTSVIFVASPTATMSRRPGAQYFCAAACACAGVIAATRAGYVSQ